MSIDDPVGKILAGLILLGFGVALFAFVSNQKRKKDTDINIYDFNIYWGSIVLMIGGLFFVYIGVKGLFYPNK